MEWRDANRDKVLNAHLERTYGITLEEYKELLIAQSGLCAICETPGIDKPEHGARKQGLTQRLHVDHDHVTGKVRGLLCGPCNRAIGLLRDDEKIIYAAADYVARGR